MIKILFSFSRDAAGLLLFSFTVGMGGDTLWHLHGFLQSIKYIIHEFIFNAVSGIATS
jgi:hypothetical protein